MGTWSSDGLDLRSCILICPYLAVNVSMSVDVACLPGSLHDNPFGSLRALVLSLLEFALEFVFDANFTIFFFRIGTLCRGNLRMVGRAMNND